MEALRNLPNNGIIRTVKQTAWESEVPVYVCDHDSSAPEDQRVEFNDENLLIRILGRLKWKEEEQLKRMTRNRLQKENERKGIISRRKSTKRKRTYGSRQSET
eukprot:1394889-Amorphochlora_amoeboformis.AAC.1